MGTNKRPMLQMPADGRPPALVHALELIAAALGATHGTHYLTVKFVDGEPIGLVTEADGTFRLHELGPVVLPRVSG
jgi:hypothetical protein